MPSFSAFDVISLITKPHDAFMMQRNYTHLKRFFFYLNNYYTILSDLNELQTESSFSLCRIDAAD